MKKRRHIKEGKSRTDYEQFFPVNFVMLSQEKYGKKVIVPDEVRVTKQGYQLAGKSNLAG